MNQDEELIDVWKNPLFKYAIQAKEFQQKDCVIVCASLTEMKSDPDASIKSWKGKIKDIPDEIWTNFKVLNIYIRKEK